MGKKRGFFHGDVFDVTMQYSKWLARLGAIGYDALILINSALNFILSKLGRPRYSLSKKVKNNVKGAVKFINKYEEIAVEIARERNYNYVVCGHIHQPAIKNTLTKIKTFFISTLEIGLKILRHWNTTTKNGRSINMI